MPEVQHFEEIIESSFLQRLDFMQDIATADIETSKQASYLVTATWLHLFADNVWWQES